jgi:undecaprenyl diphosphate synthase
VSKPAPLPPDTSRLPQHVAIIMDGNGRWARKRGLPRIAGHKVGLESVRAMVKACSNWGIPYLTLYAFSSENWRRPKAEVSFLMKLLQVYLRQELKELDENNVRLNAIGRLHELPASARTELKKSISKLSKNRGLTLSLALNYGGQQDIVDAAKKAVALSKAGKLKRLDEAAFAGLLSTHGLPEVDLVIRSSGEMRLSNFLLWQTAYAEIFVTPTLWPDFREPQLREALADFARRERRFGDVAPRPSNA